MLKKLKLLSGSFIYFRIWGCMPFILTLGTITAMKFHFRQCIWYLQLFIYLYCYSYKCIEEKNRKSNQNLRFFFVKTKSPSPSWSLSRCTVFPVELNLLYNLIFLGAYTSRYYIICCHSCTLLKILCMCVFA